MQASQKGCALVCEDKTVLGIFSERDFMKRVLAAGEDLDAPVSRFMTADPVTTPQSASVGSLIRIMYKGGYRHVPVVDSRSRPVGIVSVKRIVQYLVDHFPSAVYNLPPKPRQVQETREGA
jgi:CBS domain-containing protein